MRTLRGYALPAALALAVALLGGWSGSANILEATHFAFVVLQLLSGGALALLMIGHLLREDWLRPVRDELEGAALAMPFLAVAALPLVLAMDAGRSLATLALWSALAVWVVRAKNVRRASAIGLAPVAALSILAAIDWVLVREPFFWSSLFAFALAATQLLGALALAVLVTLLRPGDPDQPTLYALERVLLTMALLVLWTWFAQFLIVWLANLPDEAAWYLARGGGWLALLVACALALIAGSLLLVVKSVRGELRPKLASALLVAQHVGHMVYILRPGAPAVPLNPADLLVPLVWTAMWASAVWVHLRGRPNLG